MTAVEWVREDDWSKVAAGDRVRLVNEQENNAAEFVAAPPVDFGIPSAFGLFTERDGWTLYVVPKPTPALPTEPGIYVCVGGSEWEHVPLFLTPSGNWAFSNGEDANETAAHWHTRSGLVRLESQADTARKVLDFLKARPNSSTLTQDWEAAAAEFGVTL